MRIDVTLVFAPADREGAKEIAHRLEQAAQARVWLEEVTSPVNEMWDQGMASAGTMVLLSPDSVPARLEREDWDEWLHHTDDPPVAAVLIETCKYPPLLERHAFFRWNAQSVLRDIQRWAIGLHRDQGRRPASSGFDGSTEALWLALADRPGIARVDDLQQARQFAHDAAEHFRDVLMIPCAGRSIEMILGEIALNLGLSLRGSLPEACEQVASALSGTRVLVVLEGMEPDAPFVREGQASVLYAPSGASEERPRAAQMRDAFVHWPSRGTECAMYLPFVEAAVAQDAWADAATVGRAAFAMLRDHGRWFEAAHLADVLQRRSAKEQDEEAGAWAREELSWISGGERVRAAAAPVEQLSLW